MLIQFTCYGRKCFYLTTHSTHFIYGYMASDIWLRTILKGNLLPQHRLLFPINTNSKGSFICTIQQTHTTAFVTLVVEHWLEQEIAEWIHPMKDRSDDPSHHERTLLPRSYISLPLVTETGILRCLCKSIMSPVRCIKII